MSYTSWTKESFKKMAKRNKTKISKGGNPMIPYYYRKKYGRKR